MSVQYERKILKLLIAALVFMTAMVISLAILFSIVFVSTRRDLNSMKRNADIVQAINSIHSINGKDGQSIQGVKGDPGKDGKDSTSTVTIVQQPVNGKDGKDGKDGEPARQVEFDGQGNYRYIGDDIWLPLNITDKTSTPIKTQSTSTAPVGTE